MNNCDELRKELAQTFAQLKAGEIKPSEAAELANLAGKMIEAPRCRLSITRYGKKRRASSGLSHLTLA